MADATSRDGDAARARWEAHYDKRGSHYSEDAGADGQQDADILEAVAALNVGTALDVGCGVGGLCIEFNQRGWTVTGIDTAAAHGY